MSSTVVILEKTYLKAVGTGKNFSNTMRHKAVSEKIRKNKRLKGRINRLTKQIMNI